MGQSDWLTKYVDSQCGGGSDLMLHRLKIGGLAGLLAIAVIGMSGFGAVSAQDASPVAAECVSPGLPPGTPTPMEGMDMASPEAVASPESGASPEAMPMPEATPLPEGQPADEETCLLYTSD